MDWPSKTTTTLVDTDQVYTSDQHHLNSQKASILTLRTAIGAVAAPSTGVTPVIIGALPQALAGAGAVNVTTHQTNFESTGVGDALTLADGAEVGQIKVVTHNIDGGSGVLTPATFVDGTTITFTNIGEEWEGVWTATGWQTIALRDTATGGTNLPAIA